MTAANLQIINAFEKLGMSVEQIAASQEVEPLAVKAVLMQYCPAYSGAAEVTNGIEFTEEEHQMARDVIVEIARYSEDERLKLKAAFYIRDDKKGRLDLVKQMSGLNVSVITFNETMQKALAAKQRAKGAIDVKSESTLVAQ